MGIHREKTNIQWKVEIDTRRPVEDIVSFTTQRYTCRPFALVAEGHGNLQLGFEPRWNHPQSNTLPRCFFWKPAACGRGPGFWRESVVLSFLAWRFLEARLTMMQLFAKEIL